MYIGAFDRGAILNKKPVSPRLSECDTRKVSGDFGKVSDDFGKVSGDFGKVSDDFGKCAVILECVLIQSTANSAQASQGTLRRSLKNTIGFFGNLKRFLQRKTLFRLP